MNGTVDQQYNYTSGAGTARLVINKTTGSVIPAAGVTALKVGGFTLTQGTFTAPTGTFTIDYFGTTATMATIAAGTTFNLNNGTVYFMGQETPCVSQTFTIDVPDGMVFNNVTTDGTMYNCYRSSLKPVTGRKIVVQGNLIQKEGYLYGIWEVQGNVTYGANSLGGSATITLTGASAQSITMNSGVTPPTGLFTVNKSGGTATLASALSLNSAGQQMTISAGIVDMAGFALTVNNLLTISAGATLTKTGGTLTYGSLSNSGTINP